jgi:hypothetical protein
LSSACNVFVYTENLQADDNAVDLSDQRGKPKSSAKSKKQVSSNSKKQLYKLFNTAYDLAVQDDGWAHLGTIGGLLRQIDPGFDPRTYGYKQLSQLVEAHKDMIDVNTSGPKGKLIHYIRMKSKSDQSSKPKSSTNSKKQVSSNSKKQLYKLFNTAFDLAAKDDGWVYLGEMGKFLRQIDPGFDPRTYGHKQLSQLVEAHKNIIQVKTSGPKDKPIYHIRMKSKS